MTAFERILKTFPELLFQENFEFSKHTTVGLGGKASLAFYPKNAEELAELISFLQNAKIDYCILGYGSNVLVSDRGFSGVVVNTKNVSELSVNADTIICGCGCSLNKILNTAQAHGVGGFSYLEGIPATIGGAVFMNAGAQGHYICENIYSVKAIENGKCITLTNDDCLFSYKNSRFQHKASVILAVTLKGLFQPIEYIERERKEVCARRAALPKGRSMGCIFKNPAGFYAGKLIEECGLKSYTYNGAVVSDTHANFILNENCTSSDDFRKLIYFIKAKVFEKTGILLEEEIRYIGEF